MRYRSELLIRSAGIRPCSLPPPPIRPRAGRNSGEGSAAGITGGLPPILSSSPTSESALDCIRCRLAPSLKIEAPIPRWDERARIKSNLSAAIRTLFDLGAVHIEDTCR